MSLLCFLLFLLYKLLNMFRATMCPSSGADDCVVLSPRVGNVLFKQAHYQHEAITLRSRHLLKMGTWLPETCWATCKGEIKDSTKGHLVGCLSTHSCFFGYVLKCDLPFANFRKTYGYSTALSAYHLYRISTKLENTCGKQTETFYTSLK